MATQAQYDAGTAAVLAIIQKEVNAIMPQIPFIFRSKVPVDKEPEAAMILAKAAIDAALAVTNG